VRGVAADQSVKLWLVLGSDGVNVLGDLDACIYFKITISVRYIMNQNDICSASNRPEKYFNNMDYFTASVSTKLGRQRSTVSEKTI